MGRVEESQRQRGAAFQSAAEFGFRLQLCAEVVVELAFGDLGAALVLLVPDYRQSCAADRGEQAAERLQLCVVVAGRVEVR